MFLRFVWLWTFYPLVVSPFGLDIEVLDTCPFLIKVFLLAESRVLCSAADASASSRCRFSSSRCRFSSSRRRFSSSRRLRSCSSRRLRSSRLASTMEALLLTCSFLEWNVLTRRFLQAYLDTYTHPRSGILDWGPMRETYKDFYIMFGEQSIRNKISAIHREEDSRA